MHSYLEHQIFSKVSLLTERSAFKLLSISESRNTVTPQPDVRVRIPQRHFLLEKARGMIGSRFFLLGAGRMIVRHVDRILEA